MGVVDANLVEVLVEKLKSEIDEIKDIILDTLHFCMIVTTAQALRTDAMKVFVDLIQHEDNVIRSKAARNINDLRFASTCSHSISRLLLTLLSVLLLQPQQGRQGQGCRRPGNAATRRSPL